MDYVEYGISDIDCDELKRWLIDKKGQKLLSYILNMLSIFAFCERLIPVLEECLSIYWATRLQLVEEEN